MKNLIVSVLVLICFNSLAQKQKGYYGRKFFFTSDVVISSPLAYNYFSKSYEKSKYRRSLQYGNDWINYGYKYSFGFIIKNNMSISIEAGIDHVHAYLPVRGNGDYLGEGDYKLRVPKAAFNVNTFMFKLELYSRKSLAPLGLSHQIGIGFANAKMLDDHYKGKIGNGVVFGGYSTVNYTYYFISSDVLKNHYYNYDEALDFKMFKLMYGLNMKTSLSRRILLNYGFRYNLNIGIGHGDGVNDKNYIFTSNSVRKSIYNQQQMNFITFSLGLTYVL